MTLLYNLILAALDLAALGLLRARPRVWAWCAIMPCVAVAGLAWAFMLREGSFGIFRLAAWGFFLHGSVLLAGAAVVMWRARRVWAVLCGVGAATIFGIAADAFLIEPHWLEVSHVEVASPKLTRRWRIVVIADLQTDEIGDYEREVFYQAVEAKPDLILLAGDYIQAPHPQWEELRREFVALLEEMDLAAKAPVFAVRGNIDGAWDWPRLFEGLGFTCVERTQTFELDGLRLSCLGLSNSYWTEFSLKSRDDGKFHLALGHVPNFALGKVDADLMVAGHTHGGQFRLPGIGPLITHSRIPRGWAAGLMELSGGRKLLVSRGIGMEREYAPRFRFLCRPELVVIDLVPEGK